jgi:hypothetical protein
MRDHDEGDAGPLLDAHQLELGVFAQLLVQRGQGLVEQQKLWLPGQRAGQRHPLALAAGDLVRFAFRELGQLHQIQHLAHPIAALRCGHPFVLQAIGDVPFDRHVREKRVGLEHHMDGAIPGGRAGHVLTVHEDAARVGSSKPASIRKSVVLPQPEPPRSAKDLALVDGQRSHPLPPGRCQSDFDTPSMRMKGPGSPVMRSPPVLISVQARVRSLFLLVGLRFRRVEPLQRFGIGVDRRIARDRRIEQRGRRLVRIRIAGKAGAGAITSGRSMKSMNL